VILAGVDSSGVTNRATSCPHDLDTYGESRHSLLSLAENHWRTRKIYDLGRATLGCQGSPLPRCRAASPHPAAACSGAGRYEVMNLLRSACRGQECQRLGRDELKGMPSLNGWKSQASVLTPASLRRSQTSRRRTPAGPAQWHQGLVHEVSAAAKDLLPPAPTAALRAHNRRGHRDGDPFYEPPTAWSMLQAFDKLKALLDNQTFKQSDFYVAYTSVRPISRGEPGQRDVRPRNSPHPHALIQPFTHYVLVK
jgi:hypothetical protein